MNKITDFSPFRKANIESVPIHISSLNKDPQLDYDKEYKMYMEKNILICMKVQKDATTPT